MKPDEAILGDWSQKARLWRFLKPPLLLHHLKMMFYSLARLDLHQLIRDSTPLRGNGVNFSTSLSRGAHKEFTTGCLDLDLSADGRALKTSKSASPNALTRPQSGCFRSKTEKHVEKVLHAWQTLSSRQPWLFSRRFELKIKKKSSGHGDNQLEGSVWQRKLVTFQKQNKKIFDPHSRIE